MHTHLNSTFSSVQFSKFSKFSSSALHSSCSKRQEVQFSTQQRGTAGGNVGIELAPVVHGANLDAKIDVYRDDIKLHALTLQHDVIDLTTPGGGNRANVATHSNCKQRTHAEDD